MTTTLDIIEKTRSFVPYEQLLIKRKLGGVYEAEWFDITSLLLDKGQAKITRKLDTAAFGWGNFTTSSAKFKIDNTGGEFYPPNSQNSIFTGFDTRQYTKVQYKAGYKDENGDNIDETVFEGLLNEKTIKTKVTTGETTFTALAYESVLPERQTTSSQFTGSKTVAEIAQSLLSDTFISQFITYNASKINPAVSTSFDDSSEFNDRSVKRVLDDISQKSNSVWYIDDSFELVIEGRDANVGTPFAFVGGNNQSKDVNIIDITKYDEGYSNIINYIKYDDGTTINIFKDTDDNLELYGTQQLELSGADITTFLTKQTLANDILLENKLPRRRITLKTFYMPNVFELFDVVTIEYNATSFGTGTLVWNQGFWNNGDFYFALSQGFFLDANTEWIVIGWKYDTSQPVMDLFLIEKLT